MQIHAEKPKVSRRPQSAASRPSSPGRFGQSPEVKSILRPPPGTVAPIRRQAAAADSGSAEAPPSVATALRSQGRPLDAETRAFMEPRFGQDFSRVRVHSGASAEQSARDVDAQAYTLGNEIVLGADGPAPGTWEGNRLIAHELAHTLQQSRGAPAVIARKPKPPPSPPPPPPFVFTDAHMNDLRTRMLAFYNMLSPAHRGGLYRNTTVVFAVVSQGNFVTLGYTVASNSTNPSIRAAAEQLGFTRLDPEGVPKIAGEHHAEQLMLESAGKLRFKVHGMVVSRAPCQDCGPVVANAGIPIQWVPDPNPPPRTHGGGTGGPPPGTPPTAPPGGGPGPGPRGQGPGPGKGASPPKGPQTLTAEVGPKLQPVNEATPGFNPGRGQAMGGAIQQIQSRQVGGLQQAEVDKFAKRYADLQPQIAGFLAKGQSVELTLIVEKPDRPDVLCAGKVFCDQGQITYFRYLYISRVLDPIVIKKWSPPPKHATIGPAGGRDSFIPYPHQGGSIIEEKEIPHLKTDHRDYHTEFKKMTFDPQPQFNFSPARPAPRPQPPPEQPKPMLDFAQKRALAAAPATVYLLSEHMGQLRTAVEVMKKLEGNKLFGELKESMGGFQGRTRTWVYYNSEFDKHKADVLVEIVRSLGVPTVQAALNSGGNDTPGTISIWFGEDASKQ